MKWLTALLGSVVLVALVTTSQAKIKAEDLSYQQGDTVLHGYLCYDDATQESRPAVLIVHEWWGLNDYAKERAQALARAGYLALALDMYGEGKTTEHPTEASEWSKAVGENEDLLKRRFEAAYELLQKQPLAAKGKIAAIGYCFGGGVVLRMAKAGADLRGVVSFHGSLPTAPAKPGAIKAKILVCHGADDPFTDPEDTLKFQRVLTEAGADWQFISYSGAKHSFTSKAADARGIPALQYNASADRRSWRAMLAFFEEIFSD